MPDTFGEPLSHPILHNRASIEPHVLPVRVAQHTQNIEPERRISLAERGTELAEINTESPPNNAEKKDREDLGESDEGSGSLTLEEKPEEEPLVAASASS